MSNRRRHILVALLCTAVWAVAIWLGHSNGYLRFLDRLESALTDVRTLVRGVKAPPDLVTIVAIDDGIVKHGGTYPLPRMEIARIVDDIARLEPKVIAVDLLLIDKGSADGDAALAKSFAARPTVLAAAAVFPDTVQPSAESEGPLARLPAADRFLLPLPAFTEHAEVGIANVMTGQTGTPLVGPDAVPDPRQGRVVVSASCRLDRDRQAADDRARPPVVWRPADRDRDQLCVADFLLRPAPHHSHGQRRKPGRRQDRPGRHSGADCRPGCDRNRRRRFLPDAVQFTDAGGGNHFHRHHASGFRRRRRARSARSHRRDHDSDRAAVAAGRSAGLAAKRGRPPGGHRGRSDVGSGQRNRFRARDMARRRDHDRRRRAAGHPVRQPATMVGPAKRTASRRAEQVA